MTREVWFNLPGGQLATFTTGPRYWQAPDGVSTFTGAVSPADIANDFASRTRAYLTPHASGNHTFWISSDDDAELYLSTGDSKLDRVKIAFLSGYVDPFTWDLKASQRSVEIPLVAGQRYFIEVLHKDGHGGDHFEIAWQPPGEAREVIPAEALESFVADANDVDNDDLADAWEALHGFSLEDNGTLNPEQHPLADPDHDGIPNLGESKLGADPNPLPGTIAGEYGRLTREAWFDIPGGQLANFTESPRYWDDAEVVSTFPGAASPVDIGEEFAARIRGYVTAPVTGNYTFWVASDDDSELYLSTDDSKFKRVKIASLSGYVNPFTWDLKPSQKSVEVPLVAGQRYFLEALHKDGFNGDHIEIAWLVPGGTRQVIPAYALESFAVDANDVDADELPDDWEIARGFSISTEDAAPPEQHPLADPDHDGYSNIEESQFGANPLKRGGMPGTLLLETWENIPGINLSDFIWHPRFATAPDRSEFVSTAEAPTNRGNDYGARMRGYVIAPVNGDYTFHLSGDDACELWLSNNRSQFGKERIAFQGGWSDRFDWTKFGTQQSAVIPLVAGKKYYIEARQKEMQHDDHLEIGWSLPGTSVVSVIPGENLESHAYGASDPDGDDMPRRWEEAHGLDPEAHDAALDPDFDGIPNVLEYETGTNPQVKNRFDGALLHELWGNVPSYTIHSRLAEERRLQPPDEHQLALNTLGRVNYRDAYTDRYRGYLTAPVSGAYTFWANGDEEIEFWLSSSASKFKKELLVHPGPQIRDFDADLSMKSRTVQLEAGERYYVEILHVNHHGGDFCEVAWQVPDGQREIIPGSVLSSYIPIPNDQDDDDLPDDWEAANGLDPNDNGLADPKNAAFGDLDEDGLDNASEWKARTRADLADTDGDGVNDGDELEILNTSALVADVAPFESVVTLAGASYTAAGGTWTQEGSKAVQGSVRGWLEYPVSLGTAGVYEFDVAFTPSTDAGAAPEYEIVFSIDGKSVQRETVEVEAGASGKARILSPWLGSGSHTLRVFVDNSYYFRRVTVDQVEVLGARGSDANGNGTPDWVDGRLAKRNSFKTPAKSITSPVNVEGKARWSELATVGGLTVQVAPDDRWFADIPLNASGATSITALLENGAIAETRQVKWVPVNLLGTAEVVIRQGDSLKLSAFTGENGSAAESVTLAVDGVTATFHADQPLVHAFPNAGSFPVIVSHSQNGTVTTATAVVKVVAAPVLEGPVCVDGFFRTVEVPVLAADVSLQLDERIEIRESAAVSGGGVRHVLRLNTPDDRSGVFRLGGADGPVLGALQFHAMRVRSGSQTAVDFTQELGNNSWEVRLPVIADGRGFNVRINYAIFIGGVTFDDGSISKDLLYPSQFDALSGTVLTLLKVGTDGSACHRMSVWQGSERIAYGQ